MVRLVEDWRVVIVTFGGERMTRYEGLSRTLAEEVCRVTRQAGSYSDVFDEPCATDVRANSAGAPLSVRGRRLFSRRPWDIVGLVRGSI